MQQKLELETTNVPYYKQGRGKGTEPQSSLYDKANSLSEHTHIYLTWKYHHPLLLLGQSLC